MAKGKFAANQFCFTIRNMHRQAELAPAIQPTTAEYAAASPHKLKNESILALISHNTQYLPFQQHIRILS